MRHYKKSKRKHEKEIELDIEKFSEMVNELMPGESLDIDEVVKKCRVKDADENDAKDHIKEMLIISKVVLFISLLNTMLILLGIVLKSRSYRYE
ncbi:hypothetical protein SAMN04487770_12961 [Butyrivibrio sp. ob235]|uniref:hypothetical protein n=1 Tax=Butyrivibrio sp. ob235 TaxID=1761780 RepID=UPI0008D4446D|nr:hypothetical protein [Butyrivibrio sp. ob235]SEM23299.1 hypothetical protein SAMN04487770_12961 [Butyrivibrio sp. ob235]